MSKNHIEDRGHAALRQVAFDSITVVRTHDDDTCPKCDFYKTHAATCPTQLQTVEQRIRYAARIVTIYYSPRGAERCREVGISEAEIESGLKLARVIEAEYQSMKRTHGDPAYGAWKFVTAADRARKEAGERAVIDAHMEQLALDAQLAAIQAHMERIAVDAQLLTELTLPERLAASIAIANYRKTVQQEVA